MNFNSVCQTSWAYADWNTSSASLQSPLPPRKSLPTTLFPEPEKPNPLAKSKKEDAALPSTILPETRGCLSENTLKVPQKPPKGIRSIGPSWEEMEAARLKRNAAQDEYDRRIATYYASLNAADSRH